jgi:23S rRNA pseudouridine955/2504/2580 synthase
MEKFESVTTREINEDVAGGRVDNFLMSILKGVPKSMVYRIIRKGEVRVNKKRIKPEYKLQCGDIVRIPPVRVSQAPVIAPSAKLTNVQKLGQSILFENEGVIVINKPARMSVHGGSGVDYGVIEALRALRPEARYLELAHRLDRETSGCLIIAKKRSALRKLHEQFREKTMHKQYLALVSGKFPNKIKLVNAPLVKNVLSSGERFVKVDANCGKPSITDFNIRQVINGTNNQEDVVTLIECAPRTGRTHQIRVHLQYKGYPILGDDKYGIRENDEYYAKTYGLERMFLHAEKITFVDPIEGKEMTVVAPLTEELSNVLKNIKGNNDNT